MSSTLFTTEDGDIILHAKSDFDPKHDFRVHKLILSLASPVFKDMFAFPQPPDQTFNGSHQLPVIDVQEPPEVLDDILRFVYPGVEPPKINDLPKLTVMLSMADKYNITSIYPPLREKLKMFLLPTPSNPFRVYIIACRFGFSEVAREAAGALNPRDLEYLNDRGREDLQYVSSTSLFQLVQFTLARERQGLSTIRAALDQSWLEDSTVCSHHGKDAQDYYFHLQKAVEDAFITNPRVGSKDLFAVLDMVPDPPPGCDPLPKPADWYYEGGAEEAFSCPLQAMTIRRRLSEIADDLSHINTTTLDKYFGKYNGGT